MRAATLKVRAATLAAAAAVALAGCGALERIAESALEPSDTELVEAVSLTADDAGPSSTFDLYPGGDEVFDQVSLDLCFGDYPSEDLRSGRRQVAITDATGDSWVSSEAILYPTPEAAEQAMAEVEQAAEECPSEPVAPPEEGREPLSWEFGRAPDADWPETAGIQRQAYLFEVSTSDETSWTSTATYLQRGRMILALYATGPESPAVTLKNAPTPARFVAVMSARLAELSDEALEFGEPLADPNDLNV